MNLHSIFSKPVDRAIEGVIKADDTASLQLEIEEYVLTKEITKRLEEFLSAYNNYENANGVWVSGFFGSGKSHLLKMLALLLEDHQVDGLSTKQAFLEKCDSDKILQANINKAASIPSKSILFNIDQKADTTNKNELDALTSVFEKVFNEMCGYYGKLGFIAKFERDLDSRNLYDIFKKSFEELAKISWEQGREQALLESENIAEAYAVATGSSVTAGEDILGKYREDYTLSIEDFADRVHNYIQTQEKGFRLNFFVDEVGQYIADNVKLMTNLQTIAETLATKSRGQAWVIVTAQEDMSTVMGEMDKKQGNDFSKIQARFKTRMKLTSQDVAEVIQKRLLTKNEQGIDSLSHIYQMEQNNFGTLFDFADGSQTFRNFEDLEHFVQSYPFIPYQFGLFQSAIQELSHHNAFEGQHSSVGERSMLGVFQQVAAQISDHELGQLATFDLMFEGVRTALKANIQRAVLQAEEHLNNPFAVQLLKALFLVKYVKSFKPTVRNLSILMLERFNTDHTQHRKNVEEALNVLEQQTYIQRNGPHYEYLTNEEKDIESEIKQTEVDTQDVLSLLETIAFDHIIKERKIRYSANKQDFIYTRKLDDKLCGREQELAIHIISPFHEHAGNEAMLQSQSMGRNELLVVLPADDIILRDLTLFKQTEKYVKQEISTTQKDSVKRILAERGSQNQKREANIKESLKEQFAQAALFVAGTKVDIASSDAQSRIIRGFEELITKTYPHLGMLRGILYSENDLPGCLDTSDESLFGNDVAVLSEPEGEVIGFIQRNASKQVRTTVKALIECFERKPYGWSYPAILCQLAKLHARSKVELRVDGQILPDSEIVPSLKNTQRQGQIIIEPQIDFTASQLRALKDFYQEFFNQPAPVNEARPLAQEAITSIKRLISQLEGYLTHSATYPCLSPLPDAIAKLTEVANQPYTYYLTGLKKIENDLLDLKEDVIDPAISFMSTGQQKLIFDQAKAFLAQHKPNFSYLQSDLPQEIESLLADPDGFKGSLPQQLGAKLSELKSLIKTLVADELHKTQQSCSKLKDRLRSMDEFSDLSSDQQEQLGASFTALDQQLSSSQLIAVFKDALRNFEQQQYQTLLTQMTAWAKQNSPSIKENGGKKYQAPVYVHSTTIKVDYPKAWLESEQNIDAYLSSVRTAMLHEINQGKRIQI